MIDRLTADRRLPLAAIVLASAAILAAALAFQYIGGLPPCQLCIYQRIPYVVAGPLALVALLAVGRLGARGLALIVLVCAATFAAGTAVAVFHVGVEQHWWAGLASCGGTVDPSLSFDELKEQLLAAPVVRCDDVLWSMFGISMAGYNALLSAALTVLSAVAGVATWKAGRQNSHETGAVRHA